MNRKSLDQHIATLEPEHDHQEIVQLMARYEFGWESTRALELALFRTFAAPKMSSVLNRSKQFATKGQKRYDDTAIIMAEIVEHGYDSERGRAAITRLNQIHGRFQIANEDFLYVLSTFILEPIRWSAWFNWRAPTNQEQQALFFFWLEVGKRMNIRDIPESLEAFAAWALEYERQHFFYADSNRNIAEATIRVFLSWYPSILNPLLRHAIYATMDDAMLKAFGYPKQPAWLTRGLFLLFRARAWVMRWWPKRAYSFLARSHRSYPNGYEINQLGP
jgi:ER-bound oxygenase mpaB/B'/Rubber oxygenase, catalytic domain